ncbi:MAG TPA: NADH-quinone oxidoreductase subunit C [Cyclobacteriaceae bacterium]|nr:NADH-quinone oxidoreductase subunit C [Cyclobacteriaceae bacterium]
MENTIERITGLINEKLGEGTARPSDIPSNPACMIVSKEQLFSVCKLLRNDATASFEMLECITGIDNGPEAGTMEVIYNLCSISLETQIALRVIIDRTADGENLAEIDSISALWETAEWLERETFDLLGIRFRGHPDMRRILLPNDWKGHPLRKDYKPEEYFHHVKIEY